MVPVGMAEDVAAGRARTVQGQVEGREEQPTCSGLDLQFPRRGGHASPEDQRGSSLLPPAGGSATSRTARWEKSEGKNFCTVPP